MRKMLVVMTAMFLTTLFSCIEAANAKPVDRFIGQIQARTKFTEVSAKENKKFALYHGDVLVMERDNLTGTIVIVGKYYTDADNETIHPTECIIAVKRAEISPRAITFNVNINEERIDPCK